MRKLKRRTFITLLGCAAATWPYLFATYEFGPPRGAHHA
jgi:hypothetical protein